MLTNTSDNTTVIYLSQTDDGWCALLNKDAESEVTVFSPSRGGALRKLADDFDLSELEEINSQNRLETYVLIRMGEFEQSVKELERRVDEIYSSRGAV